MQKSGRKPRRTVAVSPRVLAASAPAKPAVSATKFAVAAVIVAVIVATTAVAIAFAASEGAHTSDAGDATYQGLVVHEEGTEMRDEVIKVTNFEVPGPAAGPVEAGFSQGLASATPEAPNRIGSISVPVREYQPQGDPWATLVWAHGGSFVRGTLNWAEADWVSLRFAEAGLRVISVDYVLASEVVKAPAPSNDLAAVLSWAGEHYDGPLVVGGASAGAHLATLAALAQAELSRQAAHTSARAADALILEYPTLHRVQRADAELTEQVVGVPEQRRFRPERIAELYDFYLGADDQAAASGALLAGDLSVDQLSLLPPVVMVHADSDDLRASGEQFGEQLRAAGVPVAESVQLGTVHGYMNRPEETPQARLDAQDTIDRFVAGMRAVLFGESDGVASA